MSLFLRILMGGFDADVHKKLFHLLLFSCFLVPNGAKEATKS